MKYFKKLLGERIYLSPENCEEAEKFTEWLNDFETSDYIGKSSMVIPVEAEKKYFEENINKDYNFFIVTMEDKLIGTIGLKDYNKVNRTATLGIFIGDKEYRNKGYGTEAIRLILDYGFNYLNLNNIELTLVGFNERAFKCYKKCGFKEYGRRRQSEFVNGKYYDRIYMDILACEFKDEYIRNKNI